MFPSNVGSTEAECQDASDKTSSKEANLSRTYLLILDGQKSTPLQEIHALSLVPTAHFCFLDTLTILQAEKNKRTGKNQRKNNSKISVKITFLSLEAVARYLSSSLQAHDQIIRECTPPRAADLQSILHSK